MKIIIHDMKWISTKDDQQVLKTSLQKIKAKGRFQIPFCFFFGDIKHRFGST
jgi:hypothetical protein